MTHAVKEHMALVEAYTKHTHEAIDLLAREFKAAMSCASAQEPADQSDLLQQLRAKADRIAELEEKLKERAQIIENQAKRIAGLELKLLSGCNQWQPAEQIPPEGRYIVKHMDGGVFFFEPIGGKWPDWVEKWMEIPK